MHGVCQLALLVFWGAASFCINKNLCHAPLQCSAKHNAPRLRASFGVWHREVFFIERFLNGSNIASLNRPVNPLPDDQQCDYPVGRPTRER